MGWGKRSRKIRRGEGVRGLPAATAPRLSQSSKPPRPPRGGGCGVGRGVGRGPAPVGGTGPGEAIEFERLVIYELTKKIAKCGDEDWVNCISAEPERAGLARE
jgi:hypothetical protein